MNRTSKYTRCCAVVAALGIGALSIASASAADLSVTETGPSSMAHNTMGTFTIHAANGNAFILPSGVVATVGTSNSPNVIVLSVVGSGGWTCMGTSCTFAGGRPVNTPFPPINVVVKASGHGTYQVCAHISFVPNAGTQPDQNLSNNNGCANGHIPAFP